MLARVSDKLEFWRARRERTFWGWPQTGWAHVRVNRVPARTVFLPPQKTKTVREARHFHRVKFAAASETFQVKKPHFTHDLLSERV